MSYDESAMEARRFDRDFHSRSSRFLLTMSAALRQAELYESENKYLVESLERLSTDLRALFQHHDFFVFRSQDENIFVNDQRLRCDGHAFLMHQKFLETLGERKIGGIAFHKTLEVPEWLGAISRLARFNRESPIPFEDIRESFQESGLWEKIELIPPRKMARLVSLKEQQEQRVQAVRVYAKTMALFRLYMENIFDQKHLGYYHLKLYRCIQDLASVIRDRGWRYLGLVNNKRYDDYQYNHPTNVAVMALVLAVRLDLRRARLSELGMAAILHDLGKSQLPKDLMDKRGKLTEDEITKMRSHPKLGVKALLRVKQYNESLLKRIMVMNEHHQPIQEGRDFHPYSRIIAVAETFDALTSRRPYRDAYLPDEAIKILIDMAGKKLDGDLVSLFVQAVGLYPCGSLVELNTGERAVVFEPSPYPENFDRPIIRIIQDRDGKELRPPLLVDLGVSGEGIEERWVQQCLDPEKVAINVSGYLYTEAQSDVTVGVAGPVPPKADSESPSGMDTPPTGEDGMAAQF